MLELPIPLAMAASGAASLIARASDSTVHQSPTYAPTYYAALATEYRERLLAWLTDEVERLTSWRYTLREGDLPLLDTARIPSGHTLLFRLVACRYGRPRGTVSMVSSMDGLYLITAANNLSTTGLTVVKLP